MAGLGPPGDSRVLTLMLQHASHMASILCGLLCLAYGGCVGILGAWVDGAVPVDIRLFGVAVFCHGILCCLNPQSVLHSRYRRAYAHACLLSVIVAIGVIFVLVREEMAQTRRLSEETMGGLIATGLFMLGIALIPLISLGLMATKKNR